MRTLITGAAGFAGRHLVAALRGQGHDIVAADLAADERPSAPSVEADDGVERVVLDVTDEQACWDVVHDARPELVLHLAGMAHVGQAEAAAERCLAVNAGGTRNMLAACLDGHANTRFLLVSSAEVYGRVQAAQLPVSEQHPLRPGTAYAVSKACAEMHVHHAAARGLHAVVARAFNHIGPGQDPAFVAAAFARQLAQIEAGLAEPVVRVGNLDAVRDFSDVRDTVVGYLACLDAGQPGDVFNITSGATVRIADLLDTLVKLSSADVRVEQDPERMRAVDVPIFHGDGAKLAQASGFAPRFDLERTLGAVLEDWRGRVAAQAPR